MRKWYTKTTHASYQGTIELMTKMAHLRRLRVLSALFGYYYMEMIQLGFIQLLLMYLQSVEVDLIPLAEQVD